MRYTYINIGKSIFKFIMRSLIDASNDLIMAHEDAITSYRPQMIFTSCLLIIPLLAVLLAPYRVPLILIYMAAIVVCTVAFLRDASYRDGVINSRRIYYLERLQAVYDTDPPLNQ